MIAWAHHLAADLIRYVKSFYPALKYTWVVSECSIAFLSRFYCPRHSIQHSSRTESHALYSLDCDVFVAKTLRKCASFLRHAVFPILSFTETNAAHSQSIHNRHHNKQEERIPLTLTFYSHNMHMSVKKIILKDFQFLQLDPIAADINIFSQAFPHFIQTG